MATRKRTSQYQYEPLVTPENWSGDAQRFSMRLTQILDDLYANVGSLRASVKEINSEEINPTVAFELPVGFIAPFWNEMDPNDFWPGTWELIGKNLTLVQASSDHPLGSTFGEATHMLTEDELPFIEGTMELHAVDKGSNLWHPTGVFKNSDLANYYNSIYGSGSAVSGAQSVTSFRFNVGGNKSHNNMQPSLAVNLWMRTA